jgi:hypothetical protein
MHHGLHRKGFGALRLNATTDAAELIAARRRLTDAEWERATLESLYPMAEKSSAASG